MGPPSTRCASADTLETALCAKKASPSVNRARSITIRHLTAKVKQLQEELSACEQDFEARLRDNHDYHIQIEAGLRSRLRYMEHEAAVKDARIVELEGKLDQALLAFHRLPLPQISPQTPTTVRRMRRFPGGSHGPTPLILPYVSSPPNTPSLPQQEPALVPQTEPEPDSAHSRHDSCDAFLDAFLPESSDVAKKDALTAGRLTSIFTKERLKEVFGV